MKFKKVLLFLLILALLFGNVYFYFSYRREETKLKKALIPSMKEDYFTRLLYETEARKSSEDFLISEYSEGAKEIIDRTFYSDKKEILNIPIILQNPDFPNGCEAASATMLLNYFGLSITLDDFVSNYLPMGRVYEKKGIRYGVNPSLFYAGNPRDEYRGWGCLVPVIDTSLKKAVENVELYVDNKTGVNLNYLITHIPVVIWVGIDYQEASDTYYWFNEEETEVYTYPKNSHTVLLVGYDKENFYINDPLKLEVIKVKREILEKSYDSYGRQAVTFWNGQTGISK